VEAAFVLPLLLLACAVIWWATQPKRKKRDVASLRRELASLTHDRDSAQRLIDAEAKRSPDATELELLERVIKRLRYERRR
jgi:hypothetical protein